MPRPSQCGPCGLFEGCTYPGTYGCAGVKESREEESREEESREEESREEESRKAMNKETERTRVKPPAKKNAHFSAAIKHFNEAREGLLIAAAMGASGSNVTAVITRMLEIELNQLLVLSELIEVVRPEAHR